MPPLTDAELAAIKQRARGVDSFHKLIAYDGWDEDVPRLADEVERLRELESLVRKIVTPGSGSQPVTDALENVLRWIEENPQDS